MPLRPRLRAVLALLAVLLFGLAHGQPTYTIGLDQSASGVVATDATMHVYLLDVPAGVAGFTIEVRGEDRDAGFIELGGTRTGVIPAAELYREYALQIPAGTRGFTVRLTAGGADADMAVYYGSEELYDDISLDPNPVFAVTNPRAGTYRIVVKNLLSDDLDYVLSVEADGSTMPGPGAGAAGLELGSGVVAPGGTIEVRFAGAPGNPRDWIGLYARGADDRQLVTWQYLEGAASGERTFVAPNDVGAYEFRLFVDDGYERIAVSGSFDVAAVAVPLTCEDAAGGEALGELVEGARATVSCPANCSAGASVWGTDVYTDDSNVCAAAAHVGAIDLARGGSFVVTIQSGQAGYEGSTRNGVATSPWGSWERSFAVAGGDVATDTGGGDGLEGTWQLVANGHRGILTFERQGGALVGSLSLGRDEHLDEVSFDGATVRFVRPLGASTQEYVGRFSDDGATQRLAGAFYQGAARTEYAWSAERPRPAGAASPSAAP